VRKSLSEIHPVHEIAYPYPAEFLGCTFFTTLSALTRMRAICEKVVTPDADVSALRDTMIAALTTCESHLSHTLTDTQHALIAADSTRLSEDMQRPLRRQSSRTRSRTPRGVHV
jgi:hypothetical protein